MRGAPTGISHRWFGCPCGGFMPGAVAVVVVWAGAFGCEGTAVVARVPGGELSGAPTGISHRWFGCPCGGFIPGFVADPEAIGGAGTVAGEAVDV